MKPPFRRFSPTPVAIFFALAFAVAIANLQIAKAQNAKESNAEKVVPIFAGAALPVPPQQRVPWTAPQNGIPSTFLSASEALYAAGLPDPRGCEYREFSVVAGSVWGGAGVVNMRGWLLPGEGEENRFAIGWDGLVHPVVKLGPSVALASDLAVLKGFNTVNRVRSEWRNGYGVASCLLLRLGETESVAKLRQALGLEGDPFQYLAEDWIKALWERGVCAHMRGDDRLALLDFRRLSQLRPKLEGLAKARGIKVANWGDSKPQILPFLEPLPLLLADQERRARERDNFVPKPTSEVERLIFELQNVAARQWSQPGGVDLREDAILQQLIAQGEKAVEPLLNVLENDRRLTRSVSFHRNFFPARYPQSVAKAAYVALCDIWGNYSFGSGSELEAGSRQRAVLAGRMRDYWQLYKDVSPVQRWRRVLADDKAGEEAWRQAARSLVVPKNTVFNEDNSLVRRVITGEKLALPGEILRGIARPTISELLEKRADLASRNSENLICANQIALALAFWDSRASVGLMRRQSARNLRRVAQNVQALDEGTTLNFLAQAALLRAHAGDKAALDEYARFLVRYGSKLDFSMFPEIIFEPLYRYPRHAALANAAESLFAGANSPWNPLRSSPKNFTGNVADWAGGAMICVPAFRRLVQKQLENAAVWGSVALDSSGMVTITSKTNELSFNHGVEARWKPPAGGAPLKVTIRVCDYYAWRVSRIPGAPRCEVYWPEKSRERAVVASREFLRRFAERLRPATSPDWWDSDVGARPEFPRLKRLATDDDLSRGAAIFTLTEPGQKRVAPLKLPLRARKKSTKALGWIWQAEELLQNGKWRRFYGFVGPHEIVKIPAEDIELVA